MPRTARRCVLLGLALAAGLLVLPSTPRANIAPEAAILIHVREPIGSCAQVLADCHMVVSHGDQLGRIEFYLYFQPIAWKWTGDPVQINRLSCDLLLPDSWQFVDGAFCTRFGSLDWQGAGPHALEMW